MSKRMISYVQLGGDGDDPGTALQPDTARTRDIQLGVPEAASQHALRSFVPEPCPRDSGAIGGSASLR